MTTQLVTTDTILNKLQEWVESKIPIGPEVFVDAAAKLNILLGDEQALLYQLQQDVSKLKVMHFENGDTGVKVKAKVEASEVFKSMQTQKGKVERIIEQIRIAKLQARMSSEVYKSN